MSISNEYTRIAPFYESTFGRLFHAIRLDVIRLCKEHALHSVLDIGCGTGEQGAMLIQAGIECVGIEQNEAMLAEARKRLPKKISEKSPNASSVLRLSATKFSEDILRNKGVMDVALCSLILHEMPYAERLQVLGEARHCVRHLMLVEYVLPERSLAVPASLMVHIPERLAGKRHYGCFRDFMARGGVEGFLYEQKLPVIARSTFLGGAVRVVLASL